MFWIIINFIFILCFNSLIFLCGRKKGDDNRNVQPQDQANKKKSAEQPTSKRCNSHGGLLADDPDLKSFQNKPGTSAATTPTTPEPKKEEKEKEKPKDKSVQEATDLRSFDEDGGPKKKDNKDAPTKPQLPDCMSAYAKPQQSEMLGVSMLAMNANMIDKEKLPVKLKPKEQEVIAQDSTQEETISKDLKKDSKKAKSTRSGMKKLAKKEATVRKDLPPQNPGPGPSNADKKDLPEGKTQSHEEQTQITKVQDPQAQSTIQPTKHGASSRYRSKKEGTKATPSKYKK